MVVALIINLVLLIVNVGVAYIEMRIRRKRRRNVVTRNITMYVGKNVRPDEVDAVIDRLILTQSLNDSFHGEDNRDERIKRIERIMNRVYNEEEIK